MLSPNTILRTRYRIIQQLGQGGMGAVYQAMDENLNRLVAVKEAFGSSAELRRAFRREAELLANLRHAALPKSIEHFSENNSDFFVMEFIPGHDLAELLSLRGSPFPESKVLRWADEALRVVAYLHDKGLIHRDIKPANLKLTGEGELFLLDFGLAKGAVGQMPTVLTTKSVLGFTPLYASLEQILGQRTDARSDIYSLGATFYHLLSGVAPINASTRFQIMEDEGRDPLPLMQRENPLVSPHVAGIIHRALEINRKRRPESATEMRKALGSVSQTQTNDRRPHSAAAAPPPGPTVESPEFAAPIADTLPPQASTIRVDAPPHVSAFGSSRIFSVEPPSSKEAVPAESIGKTILIAIAAVLLFSVLSVALVIWKTGWMPWSDKNLYDESQPSDSTNSASSALPASSVSPAASLTPRLASTITDGNGIEFVLIKPGRFMMGSMDGNVDERPQHAVNMGYAFYLSKYEVTQAQWRQIMGFNPSYYSDCGDNCPVENVSWHDAQRFIARLNQGSQSYLYSLPSEAEWEYACCARTSTSHSIDLGLLDTAAWYSRNEIDIRTGERIFPDDFKPTHPVGMKRPNAFGLYDMHGNVSEWCEDSYHATYDGAPNDGSAWSSSAGENERVIRGGSSFNDDGGVRSSRRFRSAPDKTGLSGHATNNRFEGFGFRLAAAMRSQ